jgi:hypothetical protein
MPITGTDGILAALMITEIDAAVAPFLADSATPPREATIRAIAKAVIEHLVANATIAVPGVTAGAATVPGILT